MTVSSCAGLHFFISSLSGLTVDSWAGMRRGWCLKSCFHEPVLSLTFSPFKANSSLFHEILVNSIRKKEQIKRSGVVTEAGRGISPYIVWRNFLTSTDFTENFTAWAKHGTRLNTVIFFTSSCKIIFIVSSNCLKQCSNTINLSSLSVSVVWKREPWASYVLHSGITSTWCSHVIWLCQVSKKEALLL